MPGESEKHLRDAFEEASEQAKRKQPTLIFLDELDSLTPVRSGQQPHEARVVAQLLTLLDGAVCHSGAPLQSAPESLYRNPPAAQLSPTCLHIADCLTMRVASAQYRLPHLLPYCK